MIPYSYVEQWRTMAPWQMLAMVEQDLVLSRALVEIFNQSIVADTLVFRGGTALNKLYIKPPVRYSEDIDLVQITSAPIGEVLNAIRSALDSWMGEPRRNLTARSAKLIYRYNALDGTPAKLKIEINTTEHFHVQPLKKMRYRVDSTWFQGEADIVTYELNELMGTKLRALYQRRKGRDLFDLWYTLDKNMVDIDTVLSVFTYHCKRTNEPVTRALFEQNLSLKREHRDFQIDILPLLSAEILWHFDEAAKMIEHSYINKLIGDPWKGKNLLKRC
jgi:predicted nucleotidyltransferase component of viral defense system